MNSGPIKIKGNPLFSPVLYAIGKWVTATAFDLVWRRKVFGREHIPSAGQGVIFAANHRSLADPNLVGSAIPYPIHYFAKEELFHVPLLGWYIRRVNAFPVSREENDIGAFKTAQRVLRAGEGLLLFPEGGRRLTATRQWKAKAGVGMLACKTQVPIVPVCIKRSEDFVRLKQIDVIFGPAIWPPKDPTRESYQAVSDQVMARIRALGGY